MAQSDLDIQTNHTHDGNAGICRNCGADAPSAFCPKCGQETAAHPPTLGEFLHEFISHYIAIDGPLMRSIWLLISAPGRLTKEYLAGRKRQYVLPLRMYLTISLLVWAGIGMIEHLRFDDRPVFTGPLDDVEVVNFGLASPRVTIKNGVFSCIGLPDSSCKRLKRRFGQSEEQLRAELNAIPIHMLSYASYSMFATVFLFAAFTNMAFRNRHMFYGEHLVFAFHLRSFTLICLLLIGLLPPWGTPVVLLSGALYYFLAIRRVYNGPLPSLLWRGTVAAVLDIVGMLLGAIVAAMVAVVF